ncbi:NAD-dependent epimerase/dehydratase family protein [Thermodesulfobacteriota bacterium]
MLKKNKMLNCCVIGGTGFIGIHVVKELLSNHRKVTVIGRNPVPSRKLPTGVTYVSGDCCNKDFLLKVLFNMDEIINLAYSTVPKTSFEDPINDIFANLPLCINLFEVAIDMKINKLVIISSGGTVYGKAIELPITENHPTNPISPYGITKLATEKYAMMYKELKGLPVVCVRPSNAFGVGQMPFLGQGFIPTAVASILKQKAITLFGDTGTVRDYIHVSDIAKGIVAALKYGAIGSFYNIGSGIGKSNRELLEILNHFARNAGLNLNVKILPNRRFDVPANILNCNKIKSETGWEPTVSLQEGLEQVWNWFSNKKNLSESNKG